MRDAIRHFNIRLINLLNHSISNRVSSTPMFTMQAAVCVREPEDMVIRLYVQCKADLNNS